MADDSFEEKTEEPTARKLEKSRSEGQVAKSTEIASVSVLLIAIAFLYYFGSFFYDASIEVMRHFLTFNNIPDFTPAYCFDLFYRVMKHFSLFFLSFSGALLLTALVTNIYQVGFTISYKAIEPKLSKISVISGLKRLFSLRTLIELIKSLTKLLITGLVVYIALKNEMNNIIHLYDQDISNILIYLLSISFRIFMWVTLIMILVAILDLVYQKWQFNKDMKMTKQEIKEEFKQSEGDPLVKSRIRSIQLQAARRRMMQSVPEADVVVTNPVHLAIAIKYNPFAMEAPKILAKGAGLIAERIKQIATENNVPIVENKELAQNLYKLVEIGDEIPSNLYLAVAEILAYVYKLKGKTL
ncbi:MAG: flagellar biosynthesis protein FlhB [Desulfobacterales bacterium]|nr:flagellar biosynthesis protein FlhB [Desulfobacterales bacterium]